MPDRIGIAEAPLATLGAANTEQNIPIAEIGEDDKTTPVRTTVADMRTYFQSNPIPIHPVDQIGRAATGTTIITLAGGTAPGAVGGSVTYRPQASTLRHLSGPEGNITVTGTGISVRDGGVYKISLRIQAVYTNTRVSAAYRWVGAVQLTANNQFLTTAGYYIRPTTTGISLTYTLGEVEYTGRLPDNAGVEVIVLINNGGSASSPTGGNEALAITGIGASSPSYITVQRIST